MRDERTLKWDERYLKLAKLFSTWSKDPSTQVGAVAIGDHGQVLAQGYNGFPRGIDDSLDRLSVRPVKLTFMIHAEMNVIFNASFNGVSLDGSTLYVYGLPVCSECCKGMIQAGFKRIVTLCLDEKVQIGTHWYDSALVSSAMLTEAEVEHVFYTISNENDDIRNFQKKVEWSSLSE